MWRTGVPLGALVSRPLVRRLSRPVAAFVLVVCAGVGGFSALAGVGAVESLFWLLDPTSIELHFATHDGPATTVKAYAIVVLSGLVVSGLWIGETVLSAAFGGRIQQELRQMQIEKTIDGLADHVIVCGYGTFGRTVAARLDELGRDVVVIEHKESQYERATERGLLALTGDARREQTLTDAGVTRAATVVGAIDESMDNIQIAIATSQLAPTATVVVRVGEEQYESLARRAGADEVVVPEVVSGEQVTTRL